MTRPAFPRLAPLSGLLLAGLALLPAVAAAQTACGAYPSGQASVTCTCTGAEEGSVWGSGPYTADSNICAAARHAGMIGAKGGIVTAIAAAGAETYTGTAANGVTSRDWGSYGASFSFGGAIPAGDPCTRMPADIERYACTCTGAENGSVWGSGPYTADSDICAAARHAGVIGSGGGLVTALRVQGLASYAGSDLAGVATRDWGSYDTSIIFDLNAALAD